MGLNKINLLTTVELAVYRERLEFPKGFLWGTATSAHQVEGGNTNNDWWEWEQKRGLTSSGMACNHYKLYEHDFDLIARLNQNAHRFSLEWSRIEPSEGRWDLSAIEHYRRVLLALKARRVEPVVTLHHFTNPLWLAKKGGWANPAVIKAFERYVEVVAQELGDLVKYWLTLNEPLVFISQGYLRGIWPPGERNFAKAVIALWNTAKAHRKASETIHAHRPEAKVGLAKNNIDFEPARKGAFGDRIVAHFAWYFWNRLFLNAIHGKYDFIGLNYYFHRRIQCNPLHLRHGFSFVTDEHAEVSDLGWEIYPQGMFRVLLELKRYQVPIYITENGIADRTDAKRPRFIVSHLEEVHRAIHQGVDVRGYFYWSLLDNFEWDKGFKPRFGLVEVDYPTQERRPRRSAALYATICEANGIPRDILEPYEA